MNSWPFENKPPENLEALVNWARARGFTSVYRKDYYAIRTMWHYPVKGPREKRAQYKLQFLSTSLRMSVLIPVPPRLRRFIKGNLMWQSVSWGYYKNLRVRGKRLTGMRLTRQPR